MKLKTSIISAISAIAAAAAIAFALTGCQGAQTKIDLPAPEGKPAYLLSVDSKNRPLIYTPDGIAWEPCEPRKCKSPIKFDEKLAHKLFKESQAPGGFIVLNYSNMKELGLIELNLFNEANAQGNCMPMGIYYYPAGWMVYYPPQCEMP